MDAALLLQVTPLPACQSQVLRDLVPDLVLLSQAALTAQHTPHLLQAALLDHLATSPPHRRLLVIAAHLEVLLLTPLDLSPQVLLRAPDISLRHRLPADPRVLLRLPLDIHRRHRAVALRVLRILLDPNLLDTSAAVPGVPLPLRLPNRPHLQVAGTHLLHDLRRFLLDPSLLSLQAVHLILVHPLLQGLQPQRVLRTPPGLQVAHIILRRHHRHHDPQDWQAQFTPPLLDLLAPQVVRIIRPRRRLPQDRPRLLALLTHLDPNPQLRQATRSPNHRDLDPLSLAVLSPARLLILLPRDLLLIAADLHRHLRGHHLEVAHPHLKARDIRAVRLLQVLPDHLTLQAPPLIHRLQRAVRPHQVRPIRQFLKVLARRLLDLRAAFLLRMPPAHLSQPALHPIRRLLRAAATRLHHRALDQRVAVHLPQYTPAVLRPQVRRAVFTAACLIPVHLTRPLAANLVLVSHTAVLQ